MPTQHIATLLGATCCVRLATVLRYVARCWVLLAQIWPFSNLSQQHPTPRNTAKRMQHVAPNNVAICWVGMLRSFGRGFKKKPFFFYIPVNTHKIKRCRHGITMQTEHDPWKLISVLAPAMTRVNVGKCLLWHVVANTLSNIFIILFTKYMEIKFNQ